MVLTKTVEDQSVTLSQLQQASRKTGGTEPKPERFLSLHDLLERGIVSSRTSARRLWEVGKFPRPVHLSERVIAWREGEVEAWMRTREYAPTFGASGKRLTPAQARHKRAQAMAAAE